VPLSPQININSIGNQLFELTRRATTAFGSRKSSIFVSPPLATDSSFAAAATGIIDSD
jgi:hypothetical protein